jgi:transcriptional regulator with XRE-family HTH domain
MGAGVHHQGAKSRRRAHRHRLRMRRMMLAKSQEKLGDALGVTFQQVQKISHVLQAPVAFFFEGIGAG